MRPIILPLVILMALRCGTGNRPTSPGEAKSLSAAQRWLDSQGNDQETAELQANRDGTNWSAFIEYQPPTPGRHTLLRIDAQGKVIEVIPGM